MLKKENFKPTSPLCVHWDGKLQPTVTDRDRVDRFWMLVAGNRVEKLHTVPTVGSGTGEQMKQALVIALTHLQPLLEIATAL